LAAREARAVVAKRAPLEIESRRAIESVVVRWLSVPANRDLVRTIARESLEEDEGEG
jgi:hypothetical protein